MHPYRIAALGVARTFQDVRLIRNMSALDNVKLGYPRQPGENIVRAMLRVGVEPKETSIDSNAFDILKQVGLSEFAERLAGELSYGQQKLLTLASCLATGASILLLDEPFSGVDAAASNKLIGLVNALREQHKTVLFVEHDMSAVILVADRVVVMSQGRVLADGNPGEVLARRSVLEGYIS
jgi:ABC-type branched-subunit amino acid transport system ATPase component